MNYPNGKMLYKTREVQKVVFNAKEESEAKVEGWLNVWLDTEKKVVMKVKEPEKVIEPIKDEIKLTPQKRAAITRKKNKAKKNA